MTEKSIKRGHGVAHKGHQTGQKGQKMHFSWKKSNSGLGKRGMNIQELTEMGITSIIVKFPRQKLVMRGHGVMHDGYQMGQDGQNCNFHGKSYFCRPSVCRYTHDMD